LVRQDDGDDGQCNKRKRGDGERLTSDGNMQRLDPDRDTHEGGKRGREGESSGEGSKVQKTSRAQDRAGKQPVSMHSGVAEVGGETSTCAQPDAVQRSDLGPACTLSEEGVSSHAPGGGGSAEMEGGVWTAANAMMSLLNQINTKSAKIASPLINHTSDHFDLMITYRVNTEKVTASRMYDKIRLTPSPALAQMRGSRSKIPAYARASSHNGDLDPDIARTFLHQKHSPQGIRWEKVFVNAVANTLVLVPLLSWYEEDGKEPSGSVGELMSLHHSDRVNNFLLEIMIANLMMKLPARCRWFQGISPIFIGKPDARGYTKFLFANIDKLPVVPSLKTCKRVAEILLTTYTFLLILWSWPFQSSSISTISTNFRV